MSEYAKIWKRVWKDPDFVQLPAATQTLYFLLISSEARSNAGVLPLTIRRWAKCSGDATPDSIRTALSQLASHNFTVVDWDTEEVLIRTFIRNDEGWKIHTVLKGILRSVEAVESPVLKQALKDELLRLPDSNGSHDLANSLVTQSELGVSDTPSDTPSVGYPIGNTISAVEGCTYVSSYENNLQPQPSTLSRSASAAPRTAKRRSQVADDYMPPREVIDAIKAETKANDEQLRYQHRKFIDHWRKTGKPMADWDACWRNWMRTSHERGEIGQPTTATGKPSKLRALADLAAEVREMETTNGKALEA